MKKTQRVWDEKTLTARKIAELVGALPEAQKMYILGYMECAAMAAQIAKREEDQHGRETL